MKKNIDQLSFLQNNTRNTERNNGLLIQIIIISKPKSYMMNSMIKRTIFGLSMLKKIPIIDLSNIISGHILSSDCELVREAFHSYNCIIVRDPRVSQAKNQSFLDLLEQYFGKRQRQIDNGEFIDVRKEHFFDIGLTPPRAVKISDEFHAFKDLYTGENAILTPFPFESLSKMRYMWNIGSVTSDIPSNVIPEDFPQFQHIMDDWGNCMFDAVSLVSELLALGLGLERQTFSEKLKEGANKLAPNANNLTRCKLGQAFTGFHNDFSFMTIHGKARFPGLYIWLRNGVKLQVQLPRGHLLIQSGRELEYLTGGYIKSGYHEVINTEEVQRKAKEALMQGRKPWRISSTMFAHLRSDTDLYPRGHYLTSQTNKLYPKITQKEYLDRQISKIQAQ